MSEEPGLAQAFVAPAFAPAFAPGFAPPLTAQKAAGASTPVACDAAAMRPAACADEVLETMPAVMDAMRSAMRRHVGEQLSVPQFRCLNWIARRPGSSVSDVAAFLGVTLPTASAMVERLVRSGALAPTTATQDRRRTELHLTAAGLAQLSEIRREARGEFARKLAVCTQHELQVLQAGLSVLRHVFAPA